MKPVFYVTFAFSFSLVFFSCGSTPKSELQAENHLEGQYSAQPSEAVSIALPPKKEKNFFIFISYFYIKWKRSYS